MIRYEIRRLGAYDTTAYRNGSTVDQTTSIKTSSERMGEKKLSDGEDSTWEKLAWDKCDPIRIERIRKMTSEKARRESMAAGLLLHEMICAYLELDPAGTPAFAIAYSENGKPYLPGNCVRYDKRFPEDGTGDVIGEDVSAEACPLWFSLSHSEDCVCCVIGDRPVGVDLQKIVPEETVHKVRTEAANKTGKSSGIDPGKEKETARLLRLAKRFFREEEYEALLQCEKNGQDAAGAFARLWTIKEAYIKMLGRRITDRLDNFEIEPHAADHGGIEIAKKAGCKNPVVGREDYQSDRENREDVQKSVCRSGVIRENGNIRGFYEEIRDESLPEGYYMAICNML